MKKGGKMREKSQTKNELKIFELNTLVVCDFEIPCPTSNP